MSLGSLDAIDRNYQNLTGVSTKKESKAQTKDEPKSKAKSKKKVTEPESAGDTLVEE